MQRQKLDAEQARHREALPSPEGSTVRANRGPLVVGVDAVEARVCRWTWTSRLEPKRCTKVKEPAWSFPVTPLFFAALLKWRPSSCEWMRASARSTSGLVAAKSDSSKGNDETNCRIGTVGRLPGLRPRAPPASALPALERRHDGLGPGAPRALHEHGVSGGGALRRRRCCRGGVGAAHHLDAE